MWDTGGTIRATNPRRPFPQDKMALMLRSCCQSRQSFHFRVLRVIAPPQRVICNVFDSEELSVMSESFKLFPSPQELFMLCFRRFPDCIERAFGC